MIPVMKLRTIVIWWRNTTNEALKRSPWYLILNIKTLEFMEVYDFITNIRFNFNCTECRGLQIPRRTESAITNQVMPNNQRSNMFNIDIMKEAQKIRKILVKSHLCNFLLYFTDADFGKRNDKRSHR